MPRPLNDGTDSHSGTQEPLVEIVTAVIVIPDLILVLTFRVEDDIRDELGEDVSEVIGSQGEGGPVVTVFHHFEDVACDAEYTM